MERTEVGSKAVYVMSVGWVEVYDVMTEHAHNNIV